MTTIEINANEHNAAPNGFGLLDLGFDGIEEAIDLCRNGDVVRVRAGMESAELTCNGDTFDFKGIDGHWVGRRGQAELGMSARVAKRVVGMWADRRIREDLA
jgi:hypothetical protein